MNRLRRRVAAGKSIRLYRGERVRGAREGRMRRLRKVTHNQSWTTSPHLALEFARRLDIKAGSAGLLYSITVPAREMADLLGGAIRPFKERGDSGVFFGERWGAMIDNRPDAEPGKGKGRLEIRPMGDRPDLKPRIVGTVVETGKTLLLGLSRRLGRRRGGRPARGGGG